ncbi:hypothetical protein ACLOAU_21515 [Niabella sp. CJ426]|jgi:hypothetical protein|uniref:hypothetical protein n=1 Tax=Niabella sp. CJ426 TaxID=3393740 RepID=UPI003D038094
MNKPRMTQVYYFQHLGIAAYRVTDGQTDWVLLKIEDPRIKARRFISLAAFEQEYQHLQQSAWYQLNHKRFRLIEAYDAGSPVPGAEEWEQFMAGIDNRQ